MNLSRGYLEIRKDLLQSNYEELKAFLDGKTRMICIVKCDGYGFDGITEAKLLQDLGADFFGVACSEEAVLLRKNGIRGDILILGHTLKDAREDLWKYDLIQTVGDTKYGMMLGDYAEEHGKVLRVHLKIDTGMHRLGITSHTPLEEILQVYHHAGLKAEGAFSHFACADSFAQDDRLFTESQKKSFDAWLKKAREAGMEFPVTHMAASAGIVNYPEYLKDYTHCRPGILFHGFDSGEMAHPYPRKEVMSLRSFIGKIDELYKGETIGYGRTYTAEKDLRVVTVPVGYGDGIPRNYENGDVLINGVRCPVIGRISMDQLCADATNAGEIRIDDPVTLIGKDGNETVTLREMADKAHTIPNEIAAKFTTRLGRRYI
ncbi:MAG: alanine racemase [Erysipelotrichales bacterium]|nr:alanine racemase [Erysipelotrichales bacterium]